MRRRGAQGGSPCCPVLLLIHAVDNTERGPVPGACVLPPVDNSRDAGWGLVVPEAYASCHAALRVPLPRLRRHFRGQPPHAGSVGARDLSAGPRRHREAAFHGRRHRSPGRRGSGPHGRRRRLLRRRLRLLTRARASGRRRPAVQSRPPSCGVQCRPPTCGFNSGCHRAGFNSGCRRAGLSCGRLRLRRSSVRGPKLAATVAA